MEEHVERAVDGQRPAKRRRFIRKRSALEDEGEGVNGSPQEYPSDLNKTDSIPLDDLIANNGRTADSEEGVQGEDTQGTHFSVRDILRQRKASQRRRGGIEFSNHQISNSQSQSVSSEPPIKGDQDEPSNDIKTVVDRFAPQTGQVADVDKHMMAYIDSEMAKRRAAQALISEGLSGKVSTSQVLDSDEYTSASASEFEGEEGQEAQDVSAMTTKKRLNGPNRAPASLGKLHEIDLGPSATLRNIARTEAAKRRLQGLPAEVSDAETSTTRPLKKPKVRLRRDGKPWINRRKRRTSQDIARDKLVEEVLRESRLEIYDEPDPSSSSAQAAAGGDQAADDAVAEQFRRDFMEAISSRRQRHAHSSASASAAKGAGGKAAVDDRPRGPKLGGSRSARAAMREIQEKEAAEKKGRR